MNEFRIGDQVTIFIKVSAADVTFGHE